MFSSLFVAGLPWQCYSHSTIIYDNLIVVLTRKHIFKRNSCSFFPSLTPGELWRYVYVFSTQLTPEKASSLAMRKREKQNEQSSARVKWTWAVENNITQLTFSEIQTIPKCLKRRQCDFLEAETFSQNDFHYSHILISFFTEWQRCCDASVCLFCTGTQHRRKKLGEVEILRVWDCMKLRKFKL